MRASTNMAGTTWSWLCLFLRRKEWAINFDTCFGVLIVHIYLSHQQDSIYTTNASRHANKAVKPTSAHLKKRTGHILSILTPSAVKVSVDSHSLVVSKLDIPYSVTLLPSPSPCRPPKPTPYPYTDLSSCPCPPLSLSDFSNDASTRLWLLRHSSPPISAKCLRVVRHP